MKAHHCVVVVGGGQAGLSASYYLKHRAIEHVVFEKHQVAYAWRQERWDSFCLVTPNWQCQLPGFPYAGPEPHGFMKKDEIVEYLESYRAWVDPPLTVGVSVESITKERSGMFTLETNCGRVTGDHVIVAAGAYHEPLIPKFAMALDPRIVQLCSRDYRSPAQLPDGAVLVVGSGQSGCQIAEDLHFAGRQVHLALGDAPRAPRVYRGKDAVAWLDEMGYYDTPVEAHPDVDTTRDKTNHYLTGRDGGREIDLRKLAVEGMKLYGFMEGMQGMMCQFRPDVAERLDAADAVYNGIRALIDGYIERTGQTAPRDPAYVPAWRPDSSPSELDLSAAGISAVVWSIGFRPDFRFIRVPVFDQRGYPRHQRGVCDEAGLYFLGLPWLHTWGSGRMAGVGRDARHVVDHISRHTGQLSHRPPAAATG